MSHSPALQARAFDHSATCPGRVASHIPNKGQVLQRYYGWYANRTRGIRRRAGAHEQPPAVETESVPPSLPEARRRWAELLRRIFEADPLRCPRCGHEMRIVARISDVGAFLLTGTSARAGYSLVMMTSGSMLIVITGPLLGTWH
jgi:hypothetical protein